jgi:hypothetical protein
MNIIGEGDDVGDVFSGGVVVLALDAVLLLALLAAMTAAMLAAWWYNMGWLARSAGWIGSGAPGGVFLMT